MFDATCAVHFAYKYVFLSKMQTFRYNVTARSQGSFYHYEIKMSGRPGYPVCKYCKCNAWFITQGVLTDLARLYTYIIMCSDRASQNTLCHRFL